MANIKGGKKFEVTLKAIASQLKSKGTVKVGFFEDARYPDGTRVALVAAVQNYGSHKKHIPPRPFFSNMVKDKSPGWPAAMRLNLIDTDYNVKITLERMGAGIRKQLQQSIIDTNKPPLAASTIARKGNDKPLVDTGKMLNSVEAKVSA